MSNRSGEPRSSRRSIPVGNTTFATVPRQLWGQHRLRRTITDHLRMLLRKHHHSRRVAQGMHLFAGSFHFADTVIDDQPTVPRQDGRSAAADFEPLPGSDWSRQPVMRKLAEVTRSTGLQGKRAVGKPDSHAIKVHFTGRGAAGGFLRTSSGKQGPVEERELRFPGWVRNGNREY